MTHFLQRTALVLTAAGLLSACASTENGGSLRPAYPVRTPEEATPAPPAPEQTPAPARPDVTTPAPPSAVDSRPLEPLTPAAPRPYAAAPPSTTSAPTVYETVTRKSVTGKVVDVDGPAKTHTVKKGENLQRIAKALDTDVETLAKDNKLKEPYLIKPGQTLKGPHSDAKAYVVGSGDTLFAIARRFGVSASAIAGENEMSMDDSLRVGRRVRLPAGFKDSGPLTTTTRVAVAQPPSAPVSTPVAPPPEPRPEPRQPAAAQPAYTPPPAVVQPTVRSQSPGAPPPQAAPVQPVRTPPPAAVTPTPTPVPVTPRPSPVQSQVPAPPPAATPTPGDAQISQLGRGRFQWPLQGDLLADFGPKAGGQRNDGINVRARAGETVRAAAAGDVVYAGDQVPGFGNLVLIKHADGWVTAYGHLGRIDVKMQQKVTQGQQIGQAGATGGVSEPQLHFEVRYAATATERARPIDPRLVLPR